jgi:hypothetical protein
MSAKRKIVIRVTEDGLREFDRLMKEYVKSKEFTKYLEKISMKKTRK